MCKFIRVTLGVTHLYIYIYKHDQTCNKIRVMAYSTSEEDSNSDSDDASDPNPIRRFLPVRGEKKQLLTQLQSIQKEVTQSERNKDIFDYGCNCCKVSPVKNALGYIYIDCVICSNTFEEVQIWF